LQRLLAVLHRPSLMGLCDGCHARVMTQDDSELLEAGHTHAESSKKMEKPLELKQRCGAIQE
jgi:hypothetical protein